MSFITNEQYNKFNMFVKNINNIIDCINLSEVSKIEINIDNLPKFDCEKFMKDIEINLKEYNQYFYY